MSDNSGIPVALRRAFVVHCVADCLFAVPLMVAPESFLTFLGWRTVDPVAARLVAAALFGIGIESYIGRNAGAEAYRGMLNLKVIWSLAAITAIGWSLAGGAHGRPAWLWALLAVFTAFNGLWIYWRARLGRIG